MPLNDLVKFAREVASEFGVDLAEIEKKSTGDISGEKEQRRLNSVLREISGAFNSTTAGGRGTAKPADTEPTPDNRRVIAELNAQIEELKRRQRRLESELRKSQENAAGNNARAARAVRGRSIDLRGVRLDSQSARNAIILSEIIGPPLAKRAAVERDVPFV